MISNNQSTQHKLKFSLICIDLQKLKDNGPDSFLQFIMIFTRNIYEFLNIYQNH